MLKTRQQITETVNSGRRELLAGGAAIALGMLAPPALATSARIDRAFWHKPRTLNLYRKETKEYDVIPYWAGGQLIRDGYAAACWLLRDVKANASVQMDPRLLDLLFGIQEYIAAIRGGADWLIVTDAYRTPATNQQYREQGLPAARASRHLYGQAADIDVNGLSAAQLGAVAKYFNGGGVGVYRSGHVHVDTGGVRTWTR